MLLPAFLSCDSENMNSQENSSTKQPSMTRLSLINGQSISKKIGVKRKGLLINTDQTIDDNIVDTLMKARNTEAVVERNKTDIYGYSHHRFKQRYEGIEVIDAEFIVHRDRDGEILYVNGRVFNPEGMSVEAEIESDEAAELVEDEYGEDEDFELLSKPELVIKDSSLQYRVYYSKNSEETSVENYICYIDALTGKINKVNKLSPEFSYEASEITTISGQRLSGERTSDDETVSFNATLKYQYEYYEESGGYDYYYYIYPDTYKYWLKDDRTTTAGGARYKQWYVQKIHKYLGKYSYTSFVTSTIYSATNFNYIDENSTNNIRTIISNTGTFNNSEISAAKNISLIQSYNYNILGRLGIDDGQSPNYIINGTCYPLPACIYVDDDHYDATNCGYTPKDFSATVRAYSYPRGSFYFGSGDGKTRGSLCILDLMAHEYGHAISDWESGIHTSDKLSEEAALAESYSDIFGTIVEFYYQPDGRQYYGTTIGEYTNHRPGYADWYIGEDTCIYSESPVAFRDMRNPCSITSKSGYTGSKYYNGINWNSSNECHARAGVQNFAFYLLSDGGSGIKEDCPGGKAYNVTGIGVQNAGAIAMYSNCNLLTSNADFQESADAWYLAAFLMGYTGQMAFYTSNVQAAWSAVGITTINIMY